MIRNAKKTTSESIFSHCCIPMSTSMYSVVVDLVNESILWGLLEVREKDSKEPEVQQKKVERESEKYTLLS